MVTYVLILLRSVTKYLDLSLGSVPHSSFLLMRIPHPGRKQLMPQDAGSLTPTWETQSELWAIVCMGSANREVIDAVTPIP